LPAPLGPTIDTHSPASIPIETSSTAVTAPNVLVTSSQPSAASDGGTWGPPRSAAFAELGASASAISRTSF